MCFPSKAPVQLGKFHLVQNLCSISFQSSSVGGFNSVGDMTCQMILHVLATHNVQLIYQGEIRWPVSCRSLLLPENWKKLICLVINTSNPHCTINPDRILIRIPITVVTPRGDIILFSRHLGNFQISSTSKFKIKPKLWGLERH